MQERGLPARSATFLHQHYVDIRLGYALGGYASSFVVSTVGLPPHRLLRSPRRRPVTWRDMKQAEMKDKLFGINRKHGSANGNRTCLPPVLARSSRGNSCLFSAGCNARWTPYALRVRDVVTRWSPGPAPAPYVSCAVRASVYAEWCFLTETSGCANCQELVNQPKRRLPLTWTAQVARRTSGHLAR